MKDSHQKIEELVVTQTERIKKKRPFLEEIDVTYQQSHKGSFFSKLIAKTRKKTIVLTQESRCPETAIRKSFNNLTKILKKKKYKKPTKLSFDFKEAL